MMILEGSALRNYFCNVYSHAFWRTSSLDKQRTCVNTQLKSSKKQLKLNVCLPKSNSVDRYAITCDVIVYLFGPFRFHLCNIQM